ncbi:hypothetical protein [Methylosinus sp. Ce-a6]|uniref:hypothetical protein n=1 Tax=Methylosinus sp. Ce-a6 TaxID=2172005 RepID=UPI00135B9490|nr:hypothetical protein [Methylosinus sp. Ce-a6]
MTTTTRRAILAGLAAAPVAGLPALAQALPGADPVLVALGDHGRARAVLDAAYARTSALSDKVEAAQEALGHITYKGEEVLNLRQLERLRSMEPRGFSDEDLERTIADLRRNNAAKRAALAEPDHEYEAARAALVERGQPLEAALREEREAEAADEKWLDAVNAAEVAIMTAEPTTQAGAAALLRFIADCFEELIDDARELAPDAIRAAVAVLEREGRA